MDKPINRRPRAASKDDSGAPPAAPASIPLEVYDTPQSALDQPRGRGGAGRGRLRGNTVRGGNRPAGDNRPRARVDANRSNSFDPAQPRRGRGGQSAPVRGGRGGQQGRGGQGGGYGPGQGGSGNPRSVPSGQLPPNIAYGMNVVGVALDAGMVKTLYFDQARQSERMQHMHAQAADQGVEVRPLQKQGWSRILPPDQHQGVAALLFDMPQVFIEEVVADAGPDSCILVLDRVQDPQNLGAVLRTAAATGVDAVVLPKAGGCPVTPAVHKSSAGMSMRVRIVEDENLARVLDFLKEQGYWVIGCDSEGGEDATTFEYPHKRVLVMGNEAEGMRRLVKESCDYLVNIPMAAGVESLNISVATAVVLYLAQADLAKAALEAPAPAAGE